MAAVERIDVEAARNRVQSGQAWLVCAYEDEEKCEKMALQGSISLSKLESRDVDQDRELIFYCA